MRFAAENLSEKRDWWVIGSDDEMFYWLLNANFSNYGLWIPHFIGHDAEEMK